MAGKNLFLIHLIIKTVRDLINASGKDNDLEVDSGINLDTIADVYNAGANVFVRGQQYLDLKTMRKQSTILEIKSLSLLILLFGSLPL